TGSSTRYIGPHRPQHEIAIPSGRPKHYLQGRLLHPHASAEEVLPLGIGASSVSDANGATSCPVRGKLTLNDHGGFGQALGMLRPPFFRDRLKTSRSAQLKVNAVFGKAMQIPVVGWCYVPVA